MYVFSLPFILFSLNSLSLSHTFFLLFIVLLGLSLLFSPSFFLYVLKISRYLSIPLLLFFSFFLFLKQSSFSLSLINTHTNAHTENNFLCQSLDHWHRRIRIILHTKSKKSLLSLTPNVGVIFFSFQCAPPFSSS